MATEKEAQDKIKEFLTNGDTHGCAGYLEDLMKRATRREIRFYSINFSIPHPVFGELSALEWAVLSNDEALFKVVKNYSQNNTATLYNIYDVSLEYLAALSGFKGTGMPRASTTARGVIGKYLMREPTPLSIAASLGHVQVIENYSKISAGTEKDWMNATSETQRKPIDIAALHNRVEACRVLLQNPIVRAHSPHNLITLSDYGNALHIAARFGHATVTHVLLDPTYSPASFCDHTEVRDRLNYTALGLAVFHVHADVVEELVVRGKADVNATQGASGLTLLQIVLSDDCKHREEILATDKFSRDKIIRVLLDAGASQEKLTEEQLAYIADLQEREALERDWDDSIVEEQEPILSLKTSSDVVKPPEHPSPNKKEPLECLLCDKKFTSAISLQAHLKSKGHVKQERKEKLQKRGQPISSQELDDHERKRIGLIERLPLLSELINLILIKLNKRDLRRFAATSKSIQMIVEKQKLLWSEITELSITWDMWEKYKERPSLFTDIAHRLPSIEKFQVKVSNVSEEVQQSMFDIPRLCTSLRELDISVIYKEYPVSWLGGVFQKNTRLTSLKVYRIIPWKRAKVQAVKDGELNPEQPAPAPANPKKPWKKKKVKQVKKPDPRKWMVDLDTVMQSGSTSLQHFTLDVGFPDDVQLDIICDFIVGIFKRLPNLTSIKLIHSEDDRITSLVLKKMLYGIFDACPKLTKVELEGEWLFGRLSNAEYEDLFKRFQTFESLKLEGSEISNFDRDIHDYIGDYCKNLKSLKISHTGEIGFNGPFFGISACSNLTKFEVWKSGGELTDGSDQFLHTVTSQCTKIQKLKIDIKPVTNAVVQGIVQLGTTLRNLRSVDQKRDFYVNYSPLVRCVNLVKLELQRITVSDTYTIIEHCKNIQDLDLFIISDEDNPANQIVQQQQQNNNNNQAQDNNNNNAQQPNNAEGQNNNEANNNNNEVANNNNEQNAANNQEGEQQANNNNNNNNPAPAPVPAPPVIHTELDFGLILEKCSELTDLYLYTPISSEASFSRMLVHTKLTKIRNLTTGSSLKTTDWPYFYLAECCPNLKYMAVDYSFMVTDACKPIFLNGFPKLEIFQGPTSRYYDFFKRVNAQRINPFLYDH